MKKFFGIMTTVAALAISSISSAALTSHFFDNAETAAHSGQVDLLNDTFKVALSNTAMDKSWTTLSQVTQISYTNATPEGPATMTVASLSQTGGVMTWVGGTVSWAVSGGALASARYFVLYDDTSATDLLIGWWDYGSSFVVADGQPLEFNLTTILTITTTENLWGPDGFIQIGGESWAAIVPKRDWFQIAA